MWAGAGLGGARIVRRVRARSRALGQLRSQAPDPDLSGSMGLVPCPVASALDPWVIGAVEAVEIAGASPQRSEPEKPRILIESGLEKLHLIFRRKYFVSGKFQCAASELHIFAA